MTDLDADQAERALVSLRAELQRRERLLATAGVADFDTYQDSGAARTETLARLVIVVDEFRALAQEVPRFVDGLVHVASLGRSLGVHLVLATQRPAGAVTADMRANVNLRIALRVRDRPDSDDVVDSPVAAGLPSHVPGRAYVRSGAEPLQLAQVAHPSDCLAPTNEGPVVRELRFGVWGATERPHGSPAPSTARTEGARALVAAVVQAARLVGARSSRPAWRPPLPHLVLANALTPAAGGHGTEDPMAATIALADHPELQSQPPLAMDLTEGVHWAFIGSGGSGRTTALLTVAHAFTARLSPSRLHLHAISDGSLRELEGLPECGVHVGPQDGPRLERFMVRLEADLAARRTALSRNGFRSMSQWWASAADAESAPAALLLLVDDWHALTQPALDPTGYWPADRLLSLLRAGQHLGLVAAVAGDRSLALGAAGSVLSRRVVLRLADPTDAVLTGLRPAWVPSDPPPGRGVLADGTQIQMAMAAPAPTAGPSGVRGAAVADSESAAFRVDPLPDLAHYAQLEVAAEARGCLVGVGGDQATSLRLSPEDDGRRWLVCGASRSGVSTTLLLLARQLLEQGRHLVVLSAHPGPLDVLRTDPRLALWCGAGDPTALVALHHRLPNLAVIVDDAGHLRDAPVEPAVQEIIRSADRNHGLVACGVKDEAITTFFTGLAPEMARYRTGVLLGPRTTAQGRAFGVQVVADPQAPAGRGYLVRQGTATRLQVALPAPSPTAHPSMSPTAQPAGDPRSSRR